jgi:hypothetical protein
LNELREAERLNALNDLNVSLNSSNLNFTSGVPVCLNGTPAGTPYELNELREAERLNALNDLNVSLNSSNLNFTSGAPFYLSGSPAGTSYDLNELREAARLNALNDLNVSLCDLLHQTMMQFNRCLVLDTI